VGDSAVVGYENTFIAVAEDCRATSGEVPSRRTGAPTVAGTQDVLLACSPDVRGRGDLGAQELERLREQYFAQPRACLRASPLPKSFGWGLHYDAQGRITLHAVDTPEYERLRGDRSLTQVRAMRSRRAAR